MKINSTTNRPLSADAVSQRPDSAVAQAYGASTPSGSSSSQVALSSASRKMLALQDGSNDINVERVAAIRAAIASGQLKIDTGRIADSLIASARDLLK
ncbi:flagellar biosynthesis anti-sigma factor FlgM [Achromobacter sp. LC458]|uniref:flagellar biosynthesis anti-sigma factor FlgM n=1 Tax=unclassified Achromobacter TaxID=2626865 RepID=UPI00062A4DD2|nr:MULTISPECIES: flagellar biosynthesis anti-sigma factor FlgM [unclassified Achromobacter]AYD64289.1 flagellar biosynthesis anti-sigma factor FlgM [Achromobacter sp. B7]MDX3986634.1 flagellar biosynthesis anti-sigma factor FlgM [Achromobacter sp.]QYJ23730.1 flagellar biosynthesis anti-sigma factor FlgM [Achromobacter sp. ES-001]TRM50293.1 flagellar biosynthesis anti-sigma factor FlgM [Achromobacter sp. LC458]HBL65229.1 flagellar biosynthesis anti-sigma factor FlgM [Achromobacter sp.]